MKHWSDQQASAICSEPSTPQISLATCWCNATTCNHCGGPKSKPPLTLPSPTSSPAMMMHPRIHASRAASCCKTHNHKAGLKLICQLKMTDVDRWHAHPCTPQWAQISGSSTPRASHQTPLNPPPQGHTGSSGMHRHATQLKGAHMGSKQDPQTPQPQSYHLPAMAGLARGLKKKAQQAAGKKGKTQLAGPAHRICTDALLTSKETK
jgi:hypothetical protein